MQFRKLANALIQEAKNEKPGSRYHSARNSSGPAGMSSSPIGRSDYNPAIDKSRTNAAPDIGASNVNNVEIVLKNAFRLIKGDAGFRNQVNKVLEAFTKKRKSISSAQEKILTINPGHIDTLNGKARRLESIIAALEDDPRAAKFTAELNGLIAQEEKYQNQLDVVIADVQDILAQNEESSLKAQDAIVKIIQATAEEEYDKLVKGMTDEEKATTILNSFDQLDGIAFSDEALEQEELRIKILSALISEDEDTNPLFKFFYLAQQDYQNALNSDAIFKKVKALTQNVTVENFFNKLPASRFLSFYNATRDDMPLRPLTGARRKQRAAASPIREILNQIVDQETFDIHRPDLLQLITDLQVDEGRMNAIVDILNGPYMRRGATAVQRLQGLLRGLLKEGSEHTNFDLMLLETLSKYGV